MTTFSVFVAATGPGVARGERRGGAWDVDRVLDEDVRCLSVDPETGDVYAGTHGNGMWRSSDGGATWNRAGLEGQIVKSVATTRAAPNFVVAGTKPPTIWVSQDGGSTWSEREAFRDIPGRSLWRQPAERPSTAYIQAVAISPTDPDVIVAGMEAGAVVRTTDGGKSWSGHRKKACRDCHSLAFHARDGTHIYEGGGGVTAPGVAVSTDAGESWSRPGDGLEHKYGWAVAADAERPDICYVSFAPSPMKAHGDRNAEAVIYRSIGLTSWQRLDGGLPQPLFHMPYALVGHPENAGELYAGLANGEIWQTIDRGDSWTRLDLQLPAIDKSLVAL